MIATGLQSPASDVCSAPERLHSIESIKGVASHFLSQFNVQQKSYEDISELISSARSSLWNSNDIFVKTSERELYEVWSIGDWDLYFWDTNLKRITFKKTLTPDTVELLSIDILNEQVHYYSELRDMGDRSNEGVYFITDWNIYIMNNSESIVQTITREQYWRQANAISLQDGITNAPAN